MPRQRPIFGATDGLPLAVIPSAASVHDSMLFGDLLRLAEVVCTAAGGLLMTIYGPDVLSVPPAMPLPIPLVTFGVARRSHGAAELWDMPAGAAPDAARVQQMLGTAVAGCGAPPEPDRLS